MSVYVDKSSNGLGRMVMCHMIADSPYELAGMAIAIGVDLKWFQNTASTPHFDICKAKRALAVREGAREVDRRLFAKLCQRVRIGWPQTTIDGWLL